VPDEFFPPNEAMATAPVPVDTVLNVKGLSSQSWEALETQQTSREKKGQAMPAVGGR